MRFPCQCDGKLGPAGRPLLVTGLVFFMSTPSLLYGQIFTDDGTPISPETPRLREKFRYQDSENAEDVTWAHEFSYALDPANELRLDVPTRHRDVRFTDNSGEKHSKTLTGLGDVSLQWQHSLRQTDWVMGSNRLAVNLTLKAPTGEDDKTVDGVDIPRRLQPGTGDWSTGVGGVYTRVEDRHRVSVQGTFTHHTRHDGIRMGEEVDLDLAYWYRLYPATFEPGQRSDEFRGIVELNSTYRFESEENGSDPGDNGWLLWASPGVQYYASPAIQLETAVQFPVVDGIEDSIGDRHYAVQFNVRFLF